MSRRVPLNVRFRPQPVVTAEVDRSAESAERLLDVPTDWLRRLHCARLDVDLHCFAGRSQATLAVASFRPLCSAIVRHPGPLGRVERHIDVWVDPSTTIRAEVVGRQVYFTTQFDDGTSLVLLPDPVVGDWVRSDLCHVLCGSSVVDADLALFRQHHERASARPLLCADGDAYLRHVRLAFLHQSKSAPAGARRSDGVLYPMTVLLAAEMIAQRNELADRMGLTTPRDTRDDFWHNGCVTEV